MKIDIDESIFEEETLPELMEESILYDRTKYGRINRTDILLPRGTPNGKNVLLTVLCNDFQITLDRIRTGKTIKLPPSYRTYIKPYLSTKKVFGIVNRISLNRKEVRSFSVANRLIWTPTLNSNSNAINDISTEINLFLRNTKNRPISTVINAFVPYLTGCIKTMPKTPNQKNIILIDAIDWLFSRTTKVNDLKGNPIYLLYRILITEPEMFDSINMDFVLMGNGTSIIFNPTKMSSKEIKQFVTNLFIFMNTNMNIMKKLEKELEKESEKERQQENEKKINDEKKSIIRPNAVTINPIQHSSNLTTYVASNPKSS